MTTSSMFPLQQDFCFLFLTRRKFFEESSSETANKIIIVKVPFHNILDLFSLLRNNNEIENSVQNVSIFQRLHCIFFSKFHFLNRIYTKQNYIKSNSFFPHTRDINNNLKPFFFFPKPGSFFVTSSTYKTTKASLVTVSILLAQA